MGQLLAFSLTSSILLAILYLTYKWALSSENYHSVNRGLLWLIYLLSIGFIPLCDAVNRISSSVMDVAPTLEIGNLMVIEAETVQEPASVWMTYILWIYAAGMTAVAGLTIFNLAKLMNIISRGEKVTVEGEEVIVTDDLRLAPFSFGNTIVIPRSDLQESGNMILLHELGHIRLHHWIDLLFAQCICVFQWYNPTSWLMREELQNVHEYQADARVVSSGANIRDYQLLLIKKAVGARFPSLANSLNHSKLKKRITMMYNQKSTRRRFLRPLLLLPAFGATLWISQLPMVASVLESVSATELAASTTAGKVTENPADLQVRPSGDSQDSSIREPADDADNTDNTDKVVAVPEQLPQFPGGDKALAEYVMTHIQYPEGAEDIHGSVVVKFVVEKDGSIGDVQVLKSLEPRFDAEAIRVVKTFPKWEPGKINDKPASVWFSMPITFKSVGKSEPESGSRVKFTSTSISTSNGKTSSVRVVTDDGEMSVSSSEDGTSSSGSMKDVTYYVDGKIFTGSLKDINPTDIESMTITKTDGQTTLINITTKK